MAGGPASCEPTSDNPEGYCDRPVLAGGWPFPILYDATYTSVPNDLGLEDLDEFEAGFCLMDAAIFGALPAAGAYLYRMRRRRSSESPPS